MSLSNLQSLTNRIKLALGTGAIPDNLLVHLGSDFNWYFYSLETNLVPNSSGSVSVRFYSYLDERTFTPGAGPGGLDREVIVQTWQGETIMAVTPTIGTIPGMGSTNFLIWAQISSGHIDTSTFKSDIIVMAGFGATWNNVFGGFGGGIINRGLVKNLIGYFPGFDDSDTWYTQLDFTSIINGVSNSYTLTHDPTAPIGTTGFFLNPANPDYMPYEYQIFEGFNLTSQGTDSRIWERGNDSIEVALSGASDLSSARDVGGTPSYYSQFYDFASTIIFGFSGINLADDPFVVETQGLMFTSDNGNGSPGSASESVSYVSGSGQALIVHNDGSWEFVEVDIPGGSDVLIGAGAKPIFTSGGKASYVASGSILLGVFNWEGPIEDNGTGALLVTDVF